MGKDEARQMMLNLLSDKSDNIYFKNIEFAQMPGGIVHLKCLDRSVVLVSTDDFWRIIGTKGPHSETILDVEYEKDIRACFVAHDLMG